MAAFYTVPSDGVYTSAIDGQRYRYTAGTVIALATAVDLGMPGAILPDPLAPFTDPQVSYLNEPIVHNYFPDGRATNPAYIDDGSYAVGKFWYKNMGGETITRVSDIDNPGGFAIQCVYSGGDWEDGLVAGDVMSTLAPLPAGRYRFAAEFKAVDAAVWTALKVSPSENGSVAMRSALVTTYWQRFIVRFRTIAAARPTLSVSVDQGQYPGATSPLAPTILCRNVMVTEGVGDFYADGDSDGWEWLGDQNASVSRGPQP